MPDLSRRQLLSLGLPVAAMSVLTTAEAVEPSAGSRVSYCLNTSTVRGAKLSLPELIRVAQTVGYDGIEPWIREIQAFQDGGGKLSDLKMQIADAGLTVESAIGFAEWIVDDETRRKAGLEAARREMALVRAIGGTRIAAPPAGATGERISDLDRIAERYAALCRVGESIGVVPELEVWGFSKTLSRLCETLYVLAACGEPSACLLPDVYHLYKGGSPFEGLRALAGSAMPVFHMNDYPADPPREEIRDGARVYPGEGVAPLDQILQTILANGFTGALSLELFNETYWREDPQDVANKGLVSMKRAVERIRD